MTKPFCSYTLDQVIESGLIPAARMEAIVADIESRITEPLTVTGYPITSAKLATFPDGTLMLYPRMDHDPKGEYIRRELLGSVLTAEELKLVNDCWSSAHTAVRDRVRFEKATKLDRWDGWVTDGDRYWADVETYLDEKGDKIEDGAEEAIPLYLWVAEPQQVIPRLDVADVVEHWIDDRGYEDMGTDDLAGVAELQAALDVFVAANVATVSYSTDHKRAVLLDAYLAGHRHRREADEECNRTGIHPIHQR